MHQICAKKCHVKCKCKSSIKLKYIYLFFKRSKLNKVGTFWAVPVPLSKMDACYEPCRFAPIFAQCSGLKRYKFVGLSLATPSLAKTPHE